MIEPLVSCARRMCKVASILPESALVSYVCLKVGVSSPVAGIVLFAGIAKAGVVYVPVMTKQVLLLPLTGDENLCDGLYEVLRSSDSNSG